jgi:hypothetical protein
VRSEGAVGLPQGEHQVQEFAHAMTEGNIATFALGVVETIVQGLLAGLGFHHGERFRCGLAVGPEEGDAMAVACGINSDPDAVKRSRSGRWRHGGPPRDQGHALGG